jgi:predicted RNase H-like nuclease (RuvC/YqgF family)
MNILRRWRWALCIILTIIAALTVAAYRGTSLSSASAVRETQDVTSLERRISLLEQRFYSVESSISRLEQQSRLSQSSPAPSTGERTLEINLLRSEIDALQRRLVEVECGLTKLDERTLTPAAREARRRAGAGNTDPCRLSVDSPLKLSTRQ